MSTRPVVCPHCKKATVAESRPSSTKRLLTVAGRGYGKADDKPGVVITICPRCHQIVELAGRLVIELS